MSYRQQPVQGPFGGVVNNIPPPFQPPAAFDDVFNFFCRKGRIQTRPKLTNFATAPDANIIWICQTFQDVLGNYHTLVVTTDHAYFLNAGPTFNALTDPLGLTTARPYAWVNANYKIYFSNGSQKIMYADGENSLKVAGDVPGSARFLTMNANHLIGAYTIETGTTFPLRVRWSKSGDPNSWAAVSSGFNDLLETPSNGITGLVTLGRITYIFRENGVSVMTPTGNGLAPFTFEHFSYSPRGIGNKYPYSLASYGTTAVFVAEDDIYMLTPSQTTPIGTSAKKAIFTDLAGATGDVIGLITPSLGPDFDFLSYWLMIPGAAAVQTWVYHQDEQNWVRFQGGDVGQKVMSISNVLTT